MRVKKNLESEADRKGLMQGLQYKKFCEMN